jgi:hypothetical protein
MHARYVSSHSPIYGTYALIDASMDITMHILRQDNEKLYRMPNFVRHVCVDASMYCICVSMYVSASIYNEWRYSMSLHAWMYVLACMNVCTTVFEKQKNDAYKLYVSRDVKEDLREEMTKERIEPVFL